jgi:hypothetical protein
VAGFFGQHGEATHKGAADAKYVDMHCKIVIWNPAILPDPRTCARTCFPSTPRIDDQLPH